MGMYTKLEAINHMLLMSGEHLVNHLEDDSGVDTSVAEHVLAESTKSYVMRGLVNNTYRKKYLPDTNGYIYLPSNTAHAEIIEAIYSADQQQMIIASYKGIPPYLFNVTDDTANWADKGGIDGVHIRIITNLDWEDIESPMQRAIMAAAARDYQVISQGDSSVDQFLAQKEAVYGAKGKAADINQKRKSFFSGGDASAELSARRNYTRNVRRRG